MTVRELDRRSVGDHIDRLYRAAWALCGNREEAEDLVQETFVRVISRPRLLHAEDDLGYLLRALRNTFLTGLRTAARRPPTEPFGVRLELVEDSRGRRPEAAAEAQEVYAAIAELPPKCRDALVAVDVLGLSYGEAGRALRVRSGTITSRLYRARGLVAARLRVPARPARPPDLSGDQVHERAAAQAGR